MGKTKKQKANELVVTQQPPSIFANQQRGKKHGFVVAVKANTACASTAILKVELLYADDLSRVPEESNKKRQPHKILQILEPADEFNAAGEARVLVRINDVSRNHRGRLFCLNLSVVNQGETTASAHTTSIKVISKHPKRKGTRSRSEESCAARPATPAPACSAAAPSSAAWRQSAFNLLKKLEKRDIGLSESPVAILQCPSCKTVGDSMSFQHLKECRLAAIIRDFETLAEKHEASASTSSDSESEYTSSSEEEEEEHRVSLADFQGCGTRTVVEDFEAQCDVSPTRHIECGEEGESHWGYKTTYC